MASVVDALTLEQRRNVARLTQDPGWLALRELAEKYREQKVTWATTVVLTEKGLPENERNYWRGYLDALHALQQWPDQIAAILGRETDGGS